MEPKYICNLHVLENRRLYKQVTAVDNNSQ